MKYEASQSRSSEDWFTMIPHSVFAWILHEDLNNREKGLVLLIIRLTLGCNDREWAELSQADLLAFGVRASHAKEVIVSALNKKVIIRNGTSNQYRINVRKLKDDEASKRLRYLIRKHSYQNGKSKVARMVRPALPNEEVIAYQSGNNEKLPKEELSRAESLSARPSKDIEIDSRKSDKKPIAFNPQTFRPSNQYEAAALKCWRILEPDKPNSFGVYLSLANKLPIDVFYRIARDVHEDMEADNPGALFNRLAHDFLKEMKNGKADYEEWF